MPKYHLTNKLVKSFDYMFGVQPIEENHGICLLRDA